MLQSETRLCTCPRLFGKFFTVLLKLAFRSATEGIYLKTRSDGILFNLLRLKVKSKCEMKCLHEFLFADDEAITSHSSGDLQYLMNRFHTACQCFGLMISLKKTQTLGQGVNKLPSISLSGYKLDAVHNFIYLGLTISDSVNQIFTMHTKIHIYRACVLGTLLNAGETWDPVLLPGKST